MTALVTLITNQADLAKTDKDGRTPLHLAAFNSLNNLEVVDTLLKYVSTE